MGVAILTCDEVRACEQRAVEAGVSLSELMRRAGHACADVLHAEFPDGRVVVLAGPGNNGGDAFVAASRLVDLGRDVSLYELAAGPRSDEGAKASHHWTGGHSPLEDLRLTPNDVVLDGLFGAGLSRPISGEAAFAVEQVNASGAKVVAIDVPSGVSGDTGDVAGPAIRADVTVTFGAKKPAHVLHPAAALCGEVLVTDIGFGKFVAEIGEGRLMENSPALWSDKLHWPDTAAHKHQRGRLAVVTGGVANTGAARLAARAGLRAGAGLVTMLCPPDALIVVAKSVEAVMTDRFADASQLVSLTEKSTAVVIGPAAGVTPTTRANVEALAKAGRSLVLDADALTVFSGQADALRTVLIAPAVLTPHAGEFERVFPGLLGKSQNKIEAARAAAAQTNAVVLLKGSDTVIAAPHGRAVINIHATPFLATAGSGDVLAGVVGGLLAQDLDPFDAACAGAWMHGDAGIRVGPGLTAEDLDGSLKESLRALYESR
jgi:ADP-dependent NAD(P)H-hydrate dehydratase / NAD(P)H-hydrate epimerase